MLRKHRDGMMADVARTSSVLLFAIWAGVVIGVSFVATPAKFLAPSLSMTVALDVGRHTFQVLGWMELVLAAATSVLCWRTRANSRALWGLGVIWLIIVGEQAWLLPVLDQRVSSFLSGSPPNVSHHHTTFVALEALKVLILLFCAGTAFRAPFMQTTFADASPDRSLHRQHR